MNREKILSALAAAESFISGFEGDELQEGVEDMLDNIRTAMEEAKAEPSPADAVSLLREFVTTWPQFARAREAAEYDDDELEINGGDLVDWCGGWTEEAEALLAGEGTKPFNGLEVDHNPLEQFRAMVANLTPYKWPDSESWADDQAEDALVTINSLIQKARKLKS